MKEYSATLTYYDSSVSRTLVIHINAFNINDAFINAASKFYALFAGTDKAIYSLDIVEVSNV